MSKFDDQISEQMVFVEWLKENGIYSVMESAETMQKMHKVWVCCGSPKPIIDLYDAKHHELINN